MADTTLLTGRLPRVIMLRPRVMAGCAAHLSSVKSSDSDVQWGSLCAIVRGAVRKPVLTTTLFSNSQFRSFDYDPG